MQPPEHILWCAEERNKYYISDLPPVNDITRLMVVRKESREGKQRNQGNHVFTIRLHE